MYYTYRVLNKNDIDVAGNGIIAKNPIDTNESVIDAVLQVNSHIQNGNTKESAWISTSKSITKVLENYAVPFFSEGKRPLVAVIDNCYETSKNIDIFEPINNQKIVVNLSNDKELFNSMSNFLFCLADGMFYVPKEVVKGTLGNVEVGSVFTLASNKNPDKKIKVKVTKGIKATPGIKYSRRTEEVIVLNKIDKDNIVKVLCSLDIDILYALAKYYEVKGIDFDTEDFINNKLNKKRNIIINNGIEYRVFHDMYVDELFSTDIVKNIYKENNNDSSIDVLEIYSYIKNIKRSIINMYLVNMGYNIDYIPLLEDNTYIVRMGNINSNTLRNISAYGNNIVLSNIGFNSNIMLDSNIRKVFPYTFIYQNNGNLYSLGTSNGIDVITDNIDNKTNTNKVKILKDSTNI